jgi:hypothetical protein
MLRYSVEPQPPKLAVFEKGLKAWNDKHSEFLEFRELLCSIGHQQQKIIISTCSSMLEIEMFINVQTGNTGDINPTTESIHRDERGQIFPRIQNPQISCSPCQKELTRKSLERRTGKKTLRIL